MQLKMPVMGIPGYWFRQKGDSPRVGARIITENSSYFFLTMDIPKPIPPAQIQTHSPATAATNNPQGVVPQHNANTLLPLQGNAAPPTGNPDASRGNTVLGQPATADSTATTNAGRETASGASKVNLSDSADKLQNTVITKLTVDSNSPGLKIGSVNPVTAIIKVVKEVLASGDSKSTNSVAATVPTSSATNTASVVTNANVAGFNILLEIVGQEITVNSPKPFPLNSAIKLLLLNEREFLALEKSVDPATNKSSQALQQLLQRISFQKLENVIQETIRVQLPRQESTRPLIELLKNHLASSAQSTVKAPASNALTGKMTIATRTISDTKQIEQSSKTIERAPSGDKILSPLLNTFINTLPSERQLKSVDGLMQLFRNSGLFLESKINNLLIHKPGSQKLAHSPLNTKSLQLGQDFKANLSRTISQILSSGLVTGKDTPVAKQLPGGNTSAAVNTATSESRPAASITVTGRSPGSLPDLISMHKLMTAITTTPVQTSQSGFDAVKLVKQLLANLSRIQLQQVNSLNAQLRVGDDAELLNHFVFEIPVRNNHDSLDWFQFNVQEREYRQGNDAQQQDDDAAPEKKEKVWNVSLTFELDNLGLVSAQVTIIESTVSAHFLAEKSSTVAKVNKHLKILKKNLEDAGVNVTQLDCRQGVLQDRKTQFQYQLVDIQT